MSGRYDQTELNVHGAEDDWEMESILDALERASRETPVARTAPKEDKR